MNIITRQIYKEVVNRKSLDQDNIPWSTTGYFSFISIDYLCCMESTRQQKLSRLIQKELGEILQQKVQGSFSGVLITVTKVQITKDLSSAKVYLSLFTKDDKQELLESIRQHTREIRFELGVRIRNQVRIIPDIHLFLDDSLDYIDRIDDLLHP
jgi:ribosome-binding factor A